MEWEAAILVNQPSDDAYIFFQDDPLAQMKIGESETVRAFSRSLTPEEKIDCREYIKYLNWPVQNHQQRMNRNLAVMCFIDGIRYQKIRKINLDPSYVQALFQVAVREIAAWSGMQEAAIRQMLTQKIHAYVQEKNQQQNT